MKEYRVKYWHQDEDGRDEYMAEIQRYVEAIHGYEVVVYPAFEV